jgi:hypothetical protein
MPSTRFAGLARPWALGIIAGAVLAILCLTLIALAQSPDPVDPIKGSDQQMYADVVGNLRQGQNFYDALRTGLSTGHYGMKSVFNWRTPFFMSLVALFPSFWTMQVVVILVTLVAAGLACWLVWREAGPIAAGILVMFEILSLGACLVPKGYLISEMPTGFVILLSASAYGLGMRRTGLATGVLALFIRELAGPYVLVCAFLAWRDRRWRELAAWLVALALYGGYFLWHAHMVALHQQAGDLGDKTSWLQFGGATFVLYTAAFNGIFMAVPLWVTALLLPAAALGLMAWPGPAGERIALTVFGYLALFALAGKGVDSYWGAIFTPVMTLGLIWFPAALRDIWRAARRGNYAQVAA